MEHIDWQKTGRDLVVSMALIGAFIAIMWMPFNLIFAFFTHFNIENPELSKANFWKFNSIFWGEIEALPNGWNVAGGYLLGVAFFAHRARSLVHGFFIPLAVFSVYQFFTGYLFTVLPILLVYVVFPVRSSSWYLCILVFMAISLPLYFIVQKFFKNDLRLTYTFTEKTCLLSSVIIPQILNAFTMSMSPEFIPFFYGIKVHGWPGN